MYAIEVVSDAFKGLRIVQQHKLVKDVISVRPYLDTRYARSRILSASAWSETLASADERGC